MTEEKNLEKSEPEFTWDRAKVKRVLDVLKTLPDFDRLPLPIEIHKAFDIPLNKPKAENMMSYVEKVMRIREHSHIEGFETRETPEDVKFPEFNYGATYYPELALDTQPTIERLSDGPTGSNETTPPLSIDLPSLPENDAEEDTNASAPRPSQDSP